MYLFLPLAGIHSERRVTSLKLTSVRCQSIILIFFLLLDRQGKTCQKLYIIIKDMLIIRRDSHVFLIMQFCNNTRRPSKCDQFHAALQIFTSPASIRSSRLIILSLNSSLLSSKNEIEFASSYKSWFCKALIRNPCCRFHSQISCLAIFVLIQVHSLRESPFNEISFAN